MAVDIAQRITNNWPRTEALLNAVDDIDYAAAKTAAIASAKRKAYGTATVPSESDIPDLVAEWIADTATIMLIPIGKEHYALTRYRSKNNQTGENISHYDFLGLLDDLKAELEHECAERWPKVEDIIGKSFAPHAEPAVSTDGLLLDTVNRAWNRGIPE